MNEEYVPEFPPSILIDSLEEGRRAYYKGEYYWDAPQGRNKEYWQQGWLSAKEFDNRR